MDERKLVRDPLRVIILAEHYRITGTVYMEIGHRLSDFLNTEQTFIPVKDVVIEAIADKRREYKFINVNKKYIIAIMPEKQEE